MQVIPQLMVLFFFGFLAMNASAQNDNEARKAAFESCRQESDGRKEVKACMTAKGFKKPDKEERQKMKAAFREAITACAAENDITLPERGTKPSAEQKAVLKACLASKGIEKPQRHWRRNTDVQ